MNKKLFAVAIILLISLPAFNINIASAASRPRVDWAILIAGTNKTEARVNYSGGVFTA